MDLSYCCVVPCPMLACSMLHADVVSVWRRMFNVGLFSSAAKNNSAKCESRKVQSLMMTSRKLNRCVAIFSRLPPTLSFCATTHHHTMHSHCTKRVPSPTFSLQPSSKGESSTTTPINSSTAKLNFTLLP